MFRLVDLATVIPDSMLLGDRNVRWQQLSIDSRTIKSGELFFALRGEKYDGHHFIRSACAKGASGIVLEKQYFQDCQSLHRELKLPLLFVENSLSALQLWAKHYYSLFKPFTICITGSNGKTTTKEMIVHLLAPKYHVLKSEGNYNNEIGVPLTLFNLDSHHDVLVIEMAARKSGEIRELTNIVHPDIAVITNIGEAHVGLFGSRENIAKEKSEIIFSLKDKGTAILNHDDTYFAYLRSCVSRHHDVLSFGFHQEAQLKVLHFRQEKEEGLHFDLLWQDTKVHQLFLPLLGKFNVYNALAAMAVGIKMNIPLDEMIDDISDFKGLDMHMERLVLDRGVAIIQDYYNANPTATREALMSIANMSERRFKVAVLGDMLELGNQAPDYHKEIGRLVASLSFDMLIGFGEFSQWLIQGAREQGMSEKMTVSYNLQDKERLAMQLMELLPDNSMVLLKGSRSMRMEEIVQYWKGDKKAKRRNCHV